MKLESGLKGHVYRDLSFDEYIALDGMNASMAKQVTESPGRWDYRRANPTPPTDGMRFGTLVHALVLEPWSYEERYVVQAKVDRRTKAGKEYIAELEEKAAAENKEIITEDERDRARAVRDRVLETLPFLPTRGDKELSLLWRQPDMLHNDDEILLKARLDWCDPKTNQIYDLKVCQDSTASGFAKACRSFQYEMQAAHYSAGFVMACQPSPGLWADKLFETKLHKVDFRFVAVEPKPPYGIGVYRITHNDLEIGRTKLRLGATLYGKYVIDGEPVPYSHTDPEGEDLQIYRG